MGYSWESHVDKEKGEDKARIQIEVFKDDSYVGSYVYVVDADKKEEYHN